ncbi:MAG: hypothetical protein ABJB65_08595 [Chloroflexota bacterium]
MSFLEKARQAAEQARAAASQGIHDVSTPEAKAQIREAAANTGSGLRDVAGAAGRGLVTAVEKIDPGILADIIIKATALQEKANRSLRTKASAYRIGELTITATIPPQIGFSIVRIGDPEDEANEIQSSGDLVEGVATADEEVISLSGDVEPMVPEA